MQIFISGQSTPITLSKDNFVHSGGEGEVYLKDDIAFKIYHDCNKVIDENRLADLSKIEANNVIAPQNYILNASNKRIGYTMRALPNTYAISRLFTNDFRNQHGITEEIVSKLILRLRNTFETIHKSNCLVVDGNEQNYLVSDDFSEVYFIDTDSFQTPSSRATAYSESTLDPLVSDKRFSEGSDWYIFGIIACQLILGSHPFKGRYKGINHSFKKGEIRARMKAGISIFHPDVKVNSAVRDISIVPDNYQDWFKDTFENTGRIAPPTLIGSFSAAGSKAAINSQAVMLEEIFESQEKILGTYPFGSSYGVKTANSFSIGTSQLAYKERKTELFLTPRGNKTCLIKCDNGELLLLNTETNQVIRNNYNLQSVFVKNNTIYGLTQDRLIEFEVLEVGATLNLSIKTTEEIMPHATQSFDGVLVQNIMGAAYFNMLNGAGSIAVSHIKELDSQRIMNSKYDKGVLIVITYDSNNYHRYTIKFNSIFTAYSIAETTTVDTLDINFCVLENGIAIVKNEKTLSLFSNQFRKDQTREVEFISDELRLFSLKNELLSFDDNKVYKMKLTN